jgi:hypothetical protein
MGDHAVLAPSAAHRWMRCAASVGLEKTVANVGSKYAAEGTVAHTIGSECLQALLKDGICQPGDYLGRTMSADGFEFCVGKDMVGYVEDYIRLVMSYAEGGQLLVERRVDFSRAIGVENSTGTSDVIILFPNRIVIIDLKYGMGVKVDAEDNEQMKLYAIGTLESYGMMVDAEDVVMVICQPRLGHVSEACITIEQLDEFAEEARLAAIAALDHENPAFEPGEKQCRFCSAKAICPALKAEITETIGHLASADDFADLTEANTDSLAVAMSKVPLIEHYCKAIRAETERRLFAGVEVEGWKLVEGRKGNRAWTDEEAAEKKLKAMKVKADDMYVQKLVSPTQAEKVLKSKPQQWEKMQEFISRADGKPSVAPVTDKRPALAASSISDFRDLITNNDTGE